MADTNYLFYVICLKPICKRLVSWEFSFHIRQLLYEITDVSVVYFRGVFLHPESHTFSVQKEQVSMIPSPPLSSPLLVRKNI